jgi:hypothetical protein
MTIELVNHSIVLSYPNIIFTYWLDFFKGRPIEVKCAKEYARLLKAKKH